MRSKRSAALKSPRGRSRTAPTQVIAQKYGVQHATTDLAAALALPASTPVILCTPTQMHAGTGSAMSARGKHVQVEIPLADRRQDRERSWRSCKRKRIGVHGRPHSPLQSVAPVGHKKIAAGDMKIQQMDVQTYFFRRTNSNALGQPRLLDRSPSLASRCTHRRSVPLSNRSGDHCG